MIQSLRSSKSIRDVAEKFGVNNSTVQRWVERAQGKRLNRVDWADRSDGPKMPNSINSILSRICVFKEGRHLTYLMEFRSTAAWSARGR